MLTSCSSLTTTPPETPIWNPDPTPLCPDAYPIGPKAAAEAAALPDGTALDRWIKKVARQQRQLEICVEKQTDFE